MKDIRIHSRRTTLTLRALHKSLSLMARTLFIIGFVALVVGVGLYFGLALALFVIGLVI